MNTLPLKYSACLFFLFLNGLVAAQTLICTPVDQQLYQEKMDALTTLRASSFGDSITTIGKSFLGTPYAEKTLEVGETETLVVNLRGLDCTTFIENVMAIGLVLREEDRSFEAFAEKLKTIRYRNGDLDGYPSRLHYFTEWIRDNQRKGLVTDITAQLGGESLSKTINFMGTHRNLYPFLKNDANFERILAMEKELAKEDLCYLPKEAIAEQEAKIQSGDIIALTTSIKGLDVTHTGLAIRIANNRIHLLHASTSGAVVISEQPLVDYLKKIKHNNGIIVARPQ